FEGPGFQFLSARGLWTSNHHWRNTYRDVLADVSQAYVLTEIDGTIGAGCWAELKYLTRPGAKLGSLTAILVPTDIADVSDEILNFHRNIRVHGYFEARPEHSRSWQKAASFKPARPTERCAQ